MPQMRRAADRECTKADDLFEPCQSRLEYAPICAVKLSRHWLLSVLVGQNSFCSSRIPTVKLNMVDGLCDID